jgi:hypothetical protein
MMAPEKEIAPVQQQTGAINTSKVAGSGEGDMD